MCWCPRTGGHGRRRWPIWSPSRDLPALADALGQALTALDRRPAWRPHHGGNSSNGMPGRIRFLMVMLSRPWSSFSPQEVRKTSARRPQDVHKPSSPTDTIRHHPCRSEALWRVNVQVIPEGAGPCQGRGDLRFGCLRPRRTRRDRRRGQGSGGARPRSGRRALRLAPGSANNVGGGDSAVGGSSGV